MELYVKTGYMLEQAFHTLTNIDFFIQGIHLHTLKAAIYEETFLWIGVLGGSLSMLVRMELYNLMVARRPRRKAEGFP